MTARRPRGAARRHRTDDRGPHGPGTDPERESILRLEALGPYLSERHCGTVSEDYSTGGNAWDSRSHDVAGMR
jgi:hypothetical protein